MRSSRTRHGFAPAALLSALVLSFASTAGFGQGDAAGPAAAGGWSTSGDPSPSPSLSGTATAAATPASTLEFQRALALVLARDPQVRGTRELAGAARAQAVQARSRLWPNAGVTASYGESRDKDFDVPVQRRSQNADAYIRWNLFNGLADKTQIEAVDKEVIAADIDLRRALDDACERTAEAYFDLLRLQLLGERSSLRLSEVEDLVRRVRLQVSIGKGSDADNELAAASLIEARLADEQVRNDRVAAHGKLRALIGESFGLLSETSVLPASNAIEPIDQVWERARAGNGAWLVAQRRADAARTRIGPIEPEYLPKLDLDLRKSLSDRISPPNSTSQSVRGWTVSLTYDIPLGGDAGAKRDESRRRAAAAEAESDRIGDGVRADLSATQQHILQSVSAAPQLERQVAHLGVVVRADELQWNSGRRSLQQLIEVRESRYAAEQRQADNRLRLVTSRLHLLALTGELAESLGMAARQEPGKPE